MNYVLIVMWLVSASCGMCGRDSEIKDSTTKFNSKKDCEEAKNLILSGGKLIAYAECIKDNI